MALQIRERYFCQSDTLASRPRVSLELEDVRVSVCRYIIPITNNNYRDCTDRLERACHAAVQSKSAL